MQIVIDISEENYKNIVEQVDKRDYPDLRTGKAIKNGTPLPKRHGRLIDEEDVGEYLTLADVPTIIKADEGVENDEKEKELIEDFIESCEKYERVEMKTEVIGVIVKMIYDLWKEVQNGKK